jgi:hypothetical protein
VPSAQQRGVWRVTLDGKQFYETDLTFRDVEAIGVFVSRPNSWAVAHPGAGPLNAVAVFAVFLRRMRPELSWEQAIEEIKDRGVGLIRSWETMEEDDLPDTFQDGYPMDPPKGVPKTPG